MAGVSQEQQDESKDWEGKSREVRLGVVMYGGISLAIYINGVAQELFLAVKGRGIYRLVKALTDSDVVVDVISGTSAGGINGIFLSYALCNNKDFSEFANLWREHGDINKLLREPDGDVPEASSFLDSEGYYQTHLEDAFRRAKPDDTKPGDEDRSEFRELDLFVTGTDVDGNVYTQFDDAGHPVDIKDHRAVFLLKHRAGRKTPFSPDPDPEVTYETLAKLSRLTSCFPVAFAPVHVDLADAEDGSADAKLQLWGRLGKEASFLDGGLLDNKPFTYTLNAIFSRTADREVDRKLLYVEPDPEVMKQAERASNPNFLQAALAALIGIPGYESISGDLKLLTERNSKLTQYNRLVRQFHPPGRIPEQTRKLYDRSRLIALSDRVVEGLFRKDGRIQQIPLKHQKRAAKLVQSFDALGMDPDSILSHLDVPYRLRRLYRLVYRIYELLYLKWEKEEDKVEVPAETKELYRGLWKALNRHIKLYEIVQAAMESLVDNAPIPWENLSKEDEARIWPQVEAGYYHLLDAKGLAAQHIQIDDLRAFLDQKPEDKPRKEWLPSTELELLRKDLKDASDKIIAAVVEGKLEGKKRGARTLLAAMDDCERLLLDRFAPGKNDPVRKAYEDFDELDAHLFPLELVGGLHEKDIIETIRISPKDAKRGFSALDLTDKVAGDAVYHFGGFFKRSWRSNDILWGRLDGLCQLVETLLDHGRVAALVGDKDRRQMIRERFLDGDVFRMELDPAGLFPRSGARTHEECRRWLTDLLSEDKDVRERALEKKEPPEEGGRFDEMVTLLVEAAQLEVLDADLRKVMVDAIEEQNEWNRFQVVDDKELPVPEEPSGKLPPFMFKPGSGFLDPLVAGSAVETRVAQFMALLSKDGKTTVRPLQTGLGSFFKNTYKVGSETLLRDIPTLILLETLARALLVARTCILGLFGSEAPRLRRNLLYRLCLDWPLRVFHALVGLARRSPGWGFGIFLGLGAVSVLALLVGVVWWPELMQPLGENRAELITFIGAPVAVLLLQGAFLLWGTRLLSRWGLVAFFVTLISAVLFACGIARWDRIYPPIDAESRLGFAFLALIPGIVLGSGFLVAFLAARRWSIRRNIAAEQRRERERAGNLRALRRIAARSLEARFGRLSAAERKGLKAIDSVERLGLLISGDPDSLSELGLAQPPPQPLEGAAAKAATQQVTPPV